MAVEKTFQAENVERVEDKAQGGTAPYQNLPFRSWIGTSLVVQWLRLHAPSAGAPCLIPGQGTRSHMLQLRVRMPQLKIPCAATKKKKKKKKEIG